MRVLVTGGAGFIGSHIVDQLLANEHQVAVVDNLETGSTDNLPEGVAFYELDVRDGEGLASAFDEFQPEAVCHQAAQVSVSVSVRQPSVDADVNVVGLLRTLENAVRTGVQRFVFASSGGVLYGNVTDPADEEHPAAPISPYGIAKWVSEKYLEFFTREFGLKTVALRYANVYGPRQSAHGEAGVVAIFTTRMLKGELCTINGDGRYIRDFVYAGDVASANVRAIERDLDAGFIPINIGTTTRLDVNELAAELRSLCQASLKQAGEAVEVPEPQHGPDRPGDLRSSIISYERARQLLDWAPKVPSTEGLAETVRWFAERR